MTSRWGVVPILLFSLAIGLPAENSQASLIHLGTFHLEIFTDDGNFANDPGVDLSVKVFDDDGQAYFEFHNDSSMDSCIAEIYFDDAGGLLSGITSIVNGPGTSFSQGGSPPILPAGNDLTLVFQKPPDFMAGADNPAPENGVNPSTAPDPDEWVAVVFDLVSGSTVSDVLDDLGDRSLRIGMHVIAFSDGSSESAVTAPEPATLGLLILGGVALLRRRQ